MLPLPCLNEALHNTKYNYIYYNQRQNMKTNELKNQPLDHKKMQHPASNVLISKIVSTSIS